MNKKIQKLSEASYEINGISSEIQSFINISCNPKYSVIVEACAGSGKTWLLVNRILHILLNGAETSEILAITFTNKAAKEILKRLMNLLKELSLSSDEKISILLYERGISEKKILKFIPLARNLYQKLIIKNQNLSIYTFHGWFAYLMQITPLFFKSIRGYKLIEFTGKIMEDAYNQLITLVSKSKDESIIKKSLIILYDLVGTSNENIRKLLNIFIDKRVEWWILSRNNKNNAIEILRKLMGKDSKLDARFSLWKNSSKISDINVIVHLLKKGSLINKKRALIIEKILLSNPSANNFSILTNQFFDKNGKLRSNLKTKDLKNELVRYFKSDELLSVNKFDIKFKKIAEYLKELLKRSKESSILLINKALFKLGNIYLNIYQKIKFKKRVIDFSDLEWKIYCLFTDNNHVIYLQNRLNTLYKYILLDEFQDTSPLQWIIIKSWIEKYNIKKIKPSIFIVGDPKQSIYRFRHADPRIFTAACKLLKKRNAFVLRANRTWRNSIDLINVFNLSFKKNPIYTKQTTCCKNIGNVWRLPLVTNTFFFEKNINKNILKNNIYNNSPDNFYEEEDDFHKKEGKMIAQILLYLKKNFSINNTKSYNTKNNRNLIWSDVIILIRKRTHLLSYESALRYFGIPFISDKRNGLLESLEITDLIALLKFLNIPSDSLSLAHVLKSPISGSSDEDLIILAKRSEKTWWKRLQAICKDNIELFSLKRIYNLLKKWLAISLNLPVCNLLDIILYEGKIIKRYIQYTAEFKRNQVIGNIYKFLELSFKLNLNNYITLSKFIDILSNLDDKVENNSPSEEKVNAYVNAVRILTVHSAKGLEAPVVIILDANHSKQNSDKIGILCNWPQNKLKPEHFSVYSHEKGMARNILFKREKKFKEQEDWNLYYVALTRAKQLLIISGVRDKNKTNGLILNSWYERLKGATDLSINFLENIINNSSKLINLYNSNFKESNKIIFSLFESPCLELKNKSIINIAHDKINIDKGIIFHNLLERLCLQKKWPIIVPTIDFISRWLKCSLSLAKIGQEYVIKVLSQSHLRRFFDASKYLKAYNEMEIVINNITFRLDRVVEFNDEIWIIEYKLNLFKSEEKIYRIQLKKYRNSLKTIWMKKKIRVAFITSDGNLLE
ncbi:UvrD-helicase domain-containing protein [Candidatus Profftella armatura (Diaphorina cf. continua)]|uniref:DNA 3'-5' helicase n=1 Tax=Candidatus Profftella armatura (Diaphorina cf. continua) TaxID=2661583 RepID=A0A7R6VZ41_9PROT|nr:UvrD-helicase domain-containing protein [Candidatus Profftella armatura (Diaphorina cf. continua)]BCG49769.1 UvrD-helicase domain-containing protein [Candidatus Profftella armatura (Diaphorina cf. continua)]